MERLLIPRPPLVDLYLSLRERSQSERLAGALEFEADPGAFAALVAASFESFIPFDNRSEQFVKHKALTPPGQIRNGHDFACALATAGTPAGRWKVPYGKQRFGFRFLEYELPPARTTRRSTIYSNAFERGGNSLLIRADALFALDDGTPVVAEAKVTKDDGYDTDTFLALVQGLTAAAMLATPNQLERLRDCYPSLGPSTYVDLALLLFKPASSERATFQYRLDATAWLLAHRVMQEPTMTAAIRRIYFIHGHGGPTDLALEAVAVAER